MMTLMAGPFQPEGQIQSIFSNPVSGAIPCPSVHTGLPNCIKRLPNPTGCGGTKSLQTPRIHASKEVYDSTYSQQSVGCKSLDVGNVVHVYGRIGLPPYSSVNTATPKWAVDRQLSAARCRLGELEAKLEDLLQRDKNVTDVDGEMSTIKDYIADLETWGHDN